MSGSTMPAMPDNMKELFAMIVEMKDGFEEMQNKINVLITAQSEHPKKSTTTTVERKTKIGINIQFMNYVTGKDGKDNGRRFFLHMTSGPDEDWLKAGKESLWPYDILAPQIALWEKEPEFNARLAKVNIEGKIKEKAKRIWKEIISLDKGKKDWIRKYLESLPVKDQSKEEDEDKGEDEPTSPKPKPKPKSAPKKTSKKPAAKTSRKVTKTSIDDSASDVSSSDED